MLILSNGQNVPIDTFVAYKKAHDAIANLEKVLDKGRSLHLIKRDDTRYLIGEADIFEGLLGVGDSLLSAIVSCLAQAESNDDANIQD